uniref:Candidate secreted effector n=1 Tax=Meloidogyne incognita TaxID=6306 RepID=A0A914M8R4_MELIC
MANRRARRDEGVVSATYRSRRVISARDQREIHRRYVEGTHSPVAAEQRYIHSSDRYYERRPRTPPPVSSTEAGPIRETRRL